MKARKEIYNLPDVHHGAPDFGELEKIGVNPDEVIDFSVNSNPYGPSPRVAPSLQDINISRYPDREALQLRRNLAEHHLTSLENILVGNGSAEVLLLTALTYITGTKPVLICGPTFGEYKKFALMMGAPISEYRAAPSDQFIPDSDQIDRILSAREHDLIFLCTPNNPTGQILPVEEIHKIARKHKNTLLVIDEAYLAFSQDLKTAFDPELENLLTMRSMTKDYSLASLRLGYALGHKDTIGLISSVRPPWNVNAYAQAAGIAALADQDYLSKTLQKTWKAKIQLLANLNELGLSPIPSMTHFFLIPVGNAAEIRAKLLQEKIQVRDCTSFGLPEMIRIAALQPEQNQLLINALKKIL
jgi:histidinol-phosphate aminotransferase